MKPITNKIGRNELCYCGSRMKYKKCCLEKDKTKPKNENKPQMTISAILDILKFGLQNLDILTEDTRKVQVKEITILNKDSIECKIYPYKTNSIDIKLEIGTIMGFLYGFFKDDSFSDIIKPDYFAVRAYNKQDIEILYAISSIETAGFISNGNSIEWLKSTLFQENTADYRLGIAKKQISEIENALRHIIVDVLSSKHKNDWWNNSVGAKLSKSVKSDYKNQFDEEIDDGATLIKYTYLLQLKKIICTNWRDFRHLFVSKIEFENSIVDLNIIRREEAHNREITEQHIEQLKKLYELLLIKISTQYHEIIPEFLIDNWKIKIKKIMNNGYKPLFETNELDEETDYKKKLIKSTVSILHLITGIKKIEEELSTIVVPIQKKEIHKEMIEIFTNYRLLQEKLIELAKKGLITELEKTLKDIECYKTKMDSFTKKFLLAEG